MATYFSYIGMYIFPTLNITKSIGFKFLFIYLYIYFVLETKSSRNILKCILKQKKT
jgi:hypothetical protein